MSKIRLLVSATLAASLVLAIAMGPADGAASPSPTEFPQRAAAQQGATWLAHQLTPAGYVPSSITPGQPDLVATANTVLALASAGVDPTGARTALGYLGVTPEPVRDGEWRRRARAAGPPHPRRPCPRHRSTVFRRHRPGGPTARHRTPVGARHRPVRLAGPDLRRCLPPGTLPGRAGRGRCHRPGPGGRGGHLAHEPAVPRRRVDQLHHSRQHLYSDPSTFEGPDTNSTALAVEGLEAQGALVSAAATKALGFISGAQDADGGWGFFPNTLSAPGSTDPDSTALVIQAIVALGQSPAAPAFVQSGGNPVSSLLSFQLTSGPGSGALFFPGSPTPNVLATYQGVPALAGVDIPFVASFPGRGYWLVAADGGIFSFGDASFFGSTGRIRCSTSPSWAWPRRPTVAGYWLVASDGGIFSFGDAAFFGSTGAMPSTSPSWAWPRPPTARATGWWRPTAASSPSVTPPSSARPVQLMLNKPIVGMASTPDGRGLLVGGGRRRHLLLR